MPHQTTDLAKAVFSTSAFFVLASCSAPSGALLAPTTAYAANAATLSASDTAQATAKTAIVYQEVGARTAQAFVDSIGVDSHFDYQGTPYVTQWPSVSGLLEASGIRHIRDGEIPMSQDYANKLASLGRFGINHSVGFAIGTNSATIAQTLEAQAPFLDFVEPQNEYDVSGDPTWATKLAQEQATLYSAVRSTTAGAKVAVLGPSIAAQQNYGALGNLNAIEDAGNLHQYVCNLNPGTTTQLGIGALMTLDRASAPGKPMWTTETGYNDDPTRACSIPDDIIAKYDPRSVAEHFNAGQPRSYFYQFADMPSDPVFGGMGMVTAAGKPKPQYTALRSMISLLSDSRISFTPRPLVMALSGQTQNVHSALLEKSDGSYVLLLWLEMSSWRPAPSNVGGTEMSVPAQTVTVSFGSRPLIATNYRYTSSWTLAGLPVSLLSSNVTLPVGDAISFLVFKP